jgi:tryptophan 7-halogenase
MSAEQPVRSILIVGGGTAGWMSATYLATQLRASGRRVTLVESKTIPIIGVGEATVPPLVGYLRLLGISEEEFMRQAHATYKLGIKFFGWHSGDDSFWHPFGPVGGNIDGTQLFHYWLQRARTEGDAGAYTSYSATALLGDLEKAPRGLAASSTVHERGQYAYHLDAGAFAEFLKREAIRRGTHFIEDDVTDVALDDRGFIKHVMTREHGALSADLYLDCSGFSAILAEKALGDRYIDWTDLLFCDRALAAPQPLGDSIAPYTRSTAMSAGWMWQIPLTQRTGNGYVFSSRFIDEGAAAREMAARLGVDAERFAPRLLRMKVGRREQFWRANCIAIGLASGFVEPLESTGIFVIQRGLALLLSYFPDCSFQPHLARRYNERMAATYEEIRDFIVLHYVLSSRADSPFWREYRALELPDSLRALLELYDATGLVEPPEYAMFPEPSWYSILAGHGRLPRAPHAGIQLSDPEKVRHIMAFVKSENEKLASALPSHLAYIRALNSRPVPASAR